LIFSINNQGKWKGGINIKATKSTLLDPTSLFFHSRVLKEATDSPSPRRPGG